MPALRFLSRRWHVASDDLVLPHAGGALVRSVWAGLLTAMYVRHERRGDGGAACEGAADFFPAYTLGAIALFALSALVDVALAAVSARGGIMDTRLRRRLGLHKLLGCMLLLRVVELAWTSLGTYWVFRGHRGTVGCPEEDDRVFFEAVIISNWVLIAVLLIVFWLVFDGHGRKGGSKGLAGQIQWRHGDEYVNMWERRCARLCCLAAVEEEHKDIFREIGHIFSDLFRNLDVVASDIAAGLVLVSNAQRKDILEKESRAGVPFNPADAREAALLRDIGHCSKYMRAAYGWPMYVFSRPACSTCKLGCCCGCCCTGTPRVPGDNVCRCNMRAVLREAGISKADIVHSTFDNRLFHTPHYVVHDQDADEIVIAVRGTLSVEDCLTDALAKDFPVTVPGAGEIVTHEGIFRNAQNVMRTLDEARVLERTGVLRNADGTPSRRRLVVVGHSLGAGTATLLALLLRERCPQLVCYAYAPPGAIICDKGSQYCQSFVTSIVIGEDIVPRANCKAIEDLRDAMVHVTAKSTVAKWHLLSRACFCFCCLSVSHLKPAKLDQSETSRLVDAYQSAIARSTRARPMHMAGQILYLKRSSLDVSSTGGRGWCAGPKPTFDAVWTDHTTFDRIIVSPSMVLDHMPDFTEERLHDCVERYLGDSRKRACRPPTPRASRPAHTHDDGYVQIV